VRNQNPLLIERESKVSDFSDETCMRPAQKLSVCTDSAYSSETHVRKNVNRGTWSP